MPAGSPSPLRRQAGASPGRCRSASPRSPGRPSPPTSRGRRTPSSLPAAAVTGCLPPWFAARAAACDDLAATGQPQPADIRHLAALTGTSETALRHALPALAGGVRPPVRAALSCLSCAARRGQHSPVPVRIPAHRRACRRHRTWLGRDIQIDITTAPDITAASRKADRLAREHGITRLVLAETAARRPAPVARTHAAALRRSRWPAPASIRASGHRRSRGLPRDDQDRGHAAPHARRTARRAGITAKNPASAFPRSGSDVINDTTSLTIEKALAGQKSESGRHACHRTSAPRAAGQTWCRCR